MITEDVVIHQPQDEAKIKDEESNSLFLAAGLRVVGLVISRMVAQLKVDRTLPFEQIRVNASKVFTKPLFSYLGWTLLFFLFGALGQTWLRWPAVWFILMSTSHIKFQTGWMRFINMPMGGMSASSYRSWRQP